MLRLLLFCCFPAFAALPVIGMARGEAISLSGTSATSTEEILGYFSIIGDSEKTPFILQITFEDCRELKERRGKLKSRHSNALPLTSFKLKYKNDQNGWENLNLELPAKGQNCFVNTEFYNNVQERYDMELWASWDNKKASAGTFHGSASFKILPRY